MTVRWPESTRCSCSHYSQAPGDSPNDCAQRWPRVCPTSSRPVASAPAAVRSGTRAGTRVSGGAGRGAAGPWSGPGRARDPR